MNKNKGFDTPKLPDDNSLEIKVIEHPFKLKSSKDDKLNTLIVNAINAMGAFGDDADMQYQKYVKQLKENSATKSILITEYSDMGESQYLDRWSIIQLVSDIGDGSTLDFFNKVIKAKIPKEKSKELHSYSTVGEEVMIRTTAIEGISKLAANGNAEAVKSLLNHTNNENFSIKRAAIQAFIEVGGKDSIAILKKHLPKASLHLLEIKRTDVRNVPQADGGLFVKTHDNDDLPKIK
jgi:hypothetical protein